MGKLRRLQKRNKEYSIVQYSNNLDNEWHIVKDSIENPEERKTTIDAICQATFILLDKNRIFGPMLPAEVIQKAVELELEGENVCADCVSYFFTKIDNKRDSMLAFRKQNDLKKDKPNFNQFLK